MTFFKYRDETRMAMEEVVVVVDDSLQKIRCRICKRVMQRKQRGISFKITHTQVALGTVWPIGFLFERPT